MRTFIQFLLISLSVFFVINVTSCVIKKIVTVIEKEDAARTDLPALIPSSNEMSKLPPVIRLHDKKTNDFVCSASVIGKNYAVTAAHCLEGRSKNKPSLKIKALNGDATPIEATAVFYEGRSDLGLLMGDFSSFNQIGITVRPGDILQLFTTQVIQVVACGFPYDGDFFCSPFEQRRQYAFGILGKGFLYPGMSGGPVLAIVPGQDQPLLIGVNTSVMEDGVYVSPVIELLAWAKVGVQK